MKVLKKLILKKKHPVTIGLEDGAKLFKKWNSQPNKPKVYVFGKRVHHGPIFTLIALYGLYKKDGYALGYGLSGLLDDIGDIEHWLNFEDGGNPNSILDVV